MKCADAFHPRSPVGHAPWLLALLVFVMGCEPQGDAERPPAPPPTPPPTTTENAAEEVDLTADKPEAEARKPKAAPLLSDLTPSGPANATARKCYAMLADIKANVETISRDLDDHGKEITRLNRTSDALSKNITDLADLWPNNQTFRDMCVSAKRQAVVLNDELSRAPRKWAHVRWAFSATIREASALRLRARDLAEAEPKPRPLVGKDGKPILDKEGRQIYEEPGAAPVDPAIAAREKNLRETKADLERLRKLDARKNEKKMPTDLDGN
ncbi:MAG: hypothetical protein NTW87_32355 [Planctomycetota bacterium]|nr:hypothetical protein [Planctomycetota bacterium]